MKAFYNKYPNKEQSYIKYNYVYDISQQENEYQIKKIKYSWLYTVECYSLEIIKIDFIKRYSEVKSYVVKKSFLAPNFNYTMKFIGKEDTTEYHNSNGIGSREQKGIKFLEESIKKN